MHRRNSVAFSGVSISTAAAVEMPSRILSPCSSSSASSKAFHPSKACGGGVNGVEEECNHQPIVATSDNGDTFDGEFCCRMYDGEDTHWSSIYDAGESSFSGANPRFHSPANNSEPIGTLDPTVAVSPSKNCRSFDQISRSIGKGADPLHRVFNGTTGTNCRKSKASDRQRGIKILCRRTLTLRIQSGSRSRRRQSEGGRTGNERDTSWGTGKDLQALGLFLGMPIAAVFSQVLDRRSDAGEMIQSDHLSRIFSSALKESLVHVFGNRSNCFIRNFEKSFCSTLKTLRSINHASIDEQKIPRCTSNVKDDCALETLSCSLGNPEPSNAEGVRDSMLLDSMSQQIILHGQVSNQELAHVAPGASDLGFQRSILGTFERSVVEQARSNDLKMFENALTMQKVQLKRSQLALDSNSNLLKGIKILMGKSKASFKGEKLKSQIQDAKYAEFLRKCTDCLVFGLVMMSASLAYGAYIFSYSRITETTASCMASPKESRSWWIKNPLASMSAPLHILKCQIQVVSRMLFGFLMILALAYSLLQRSDASRQTMPLTFILLLLGVGCGFAGKLCVDALGGSGYDWLLYWEALCSLHLFANTCTSSLFYVLNGPVSISQGAEEVRVMMPYWFRRCTFYSLALIVLPVLCGLMPFASLNSWQLHFTSLMGINH